MKVYLGIFGTAILAFGLTGGGNSFVSAQYLPPPLINESAQADADSETEKKSEEPSDVVEDHSSTDSSEKAEMATTRIGLPKLQSANSSSQNAPSQPHVVQTLNATGVPQQVPGMQAHTILYFPPPTFPEPIPLTLYRPGPQQMMGIGVMGNGTAQNGIPMQAGANLGGQNTMSAAQQMYAPPMIIHPQYFGSAKGGYANSDSGNHGYCMDHSQEGKKRLGKLFKSKTPTQPGDPVLAPPILVYPNGMIVKPKVYLPDQPFKNTIRAFTP